MFDMTNDSHLFRTAKELEGAQGAWPIGGNRWQSPTGEWVPLYVGKMFWHLDHRASSVTANDANLHHAALSEELDAESKANPDIYATPQYWVNREEIGLEANWALGFRSISNATNERTVVTSILPLAGYGNSSPILQLHNATDAALLCANLCSLVLDYVARHKVQGTNVNWFMIEQLPVVPPAAYDRSFGPRTAGDIVRDAVLELTYTAHDLAPFARDLGRVDDAGEVRPPFRWDEDRRLHLRAKLDALYFLLTGVVNPADPATDRDDVAYIFSTFPIVEREETARWGRYRSRDLTLAWINALLAGQPDADIRD